MNASLLPTAKSPYASPDAKWPEPAESKWYYLPVPIPSASIAWVSGETNMQWRLGLSVGHLIQSTPTRMRMILPTLAWVRTGGENGVALSVDTFASNAPLAWSAGVEWYPGDDTVAQMLRVSPVAGVLYVEGRHADDGDDDTWQALVGVDAARLGIMILGIKFIKKMQESNQSQPTTDH